MAAVKKMTAANTAAAKTAAAKTAAAKTAAAKTAVPKKAAPRKAAPKKAAKAPAAEPVLALVAEVAKLAPPVEHLAQPVVPSVPPAEAKPAPVKRPKNARYQLPSNMEIAALGPVHAELLALKSSNDGPFVLDGANLNVIDAAGLQLLVSFVTTMQAEGRKISWENYSVQAYQLASELGVVDQLGD